MRIFVSLRNLLACPVCKTSVDDEGFVALVCGSCGRRYPRKNGVPIMLTEPERADIAHEGELGVRPGYARWKERIVIKSLAPDHVVLDFGAGNQDVDDPAVIRMDVTYSPYADVVADVHALPFKPDSIDFAFGGAVFEHLRRPWDAARELYSAIKPGGYVYADWNFVFAYHGYPNHFFNASIHGVKEIFRDFVEIEMGIAPFHRPAFALRSVLGTYLAHFKPTTRLEREFQDLLHRVLWHPLDDFDRKFDPSDLFRVAASAYFFGVKQTENLETLVPKPVRSAYERSPDLQKRFPKPLDIAQPDNLMWWAKHEGVRLDPAIRAYFASVKPFNKRGDEKRRERTTVDSWSMELLQAVEPPADEPQKRMALWFSRPLRTRLSEKWENEGVWGVIKCLGGSAKRRWHLLKG